MHPSAGDLVQRGSMETQLEAEPEAERFAQGTTYDVDLQNTKSTVLHVYSKARTYQITFKSHRRTQRPFKDLLAL